jgi:hypothetical protein
MSFNLDIDVLANNKIDIEHHNLAHVREYGPSYSIKLIPINKVELKFLAKFLLNLRKNFDRKKVEFFHLLA